MWSLLCKDSYSMPEAHAPWKYSRLPLHLAVSPRTQDFKVARDGLVIRVLFHAIHVSAPQRFFIASWEASDASKVIMGNNALRDAKQEWDFHLEIYLS